MYRIHCACGGDSAAWCKQRKMAVAGIQPRRVQIMKSTLIRWSLCLGLSLAVAVQVTWAQGIPALPGGDMAPPPLPPGASEAPMPAAPMSAAPMPGGTGGYGGLSDYGMGGAPAGDVGGNTCNNCGVSCTSPGCCDACAASGFGGGGWFGGGGCGGGCRVNTFGS